MKRKSHTSLIIGLLLCAAGNEIAARSASQGEAKALATLTVNTLADTNDGVCDAASCSLREAVAAAVSGDTINFSVTGTIVLGGTAIQIAKNLNIMGPGAGSLSVSGNNASGVFHLPGAFTVVIDGITVTGGNPSAVGGGGGGIFISGGGGSNVTISNSSVSNNNGGGGAGGGILNNGTLNISNSVISGNSTTSNSGGIANNGGTLTVTNSTISGNQAGTVSVPSYGGGIANNGFTASTVSIVNSTISGNSARDGGGLYNFAVGGTAGVTSTITNSTFSGNSCDANGCAIYNDRGTVNLTHATVTNNTSTLGGSAVASFLGSPTTNVRNTIIAANTPSREAEGAFVSSGYNLIGNADGATGFTATGDQTGTTAAPLNPMLGPLANNGGPTMTHALLPNSPAMDKGNSFGLTTDQRGAIRPVDNPMIPNATGGDGSDIGSFELQAPTAANVQVSGRVVTAAGRGIAKAQVTLVDSTGSLRSALSNAFGYYRFDDLEAGETYLLTVRSKRYVFANPSQVVTALDSLTDVDFTASP